MVRQYIGARYVTKIYENSQDPSSAEWEAGVNYEPLTMVTYNNGSYLSKKEVPAATGDPASNPTYWVQTGFYNGQIASLTSRMDAAENNITFIRSAAVYFSDLIGDTDTEKIQYAYDNGISFQLDRDISIGAVDIAKENYVYMFGNGHTVNMSGKIESTTAWGMNFWWYDCIFDGTDGGYFNIDEPKLVDCRFMNCCFIHFTHDIFVGHLQCFSFIGCFFKYNTCIVFNITRCDGLWIETCNFEQSNDGIITLTNNGYNLVVRDTIVESTTGTAFDLKQLADSTFENVYLEANTKNFVITADHCGNIAFNHIHGNLINATDALIEFTKTDLDAFMYGVIKVDNSSLNKGVFFKLCDTTKPFWCSVVNSNVASNIVNTEFFDKTDVTSMTTAYIRSNDVHVQPIQLTSSYPTTGSWVNIGNFSTIPIGHKMIGVTVVDSTNMTTPHPQVNAAGNSMQYFGYGSAATVNLNVLYE